MLVVLGKVQQREASFTNYRPAKKMLHVCIESTLRGTAGRRRLFVLLAGCGSTHIMNFCEHYGLPRSQIFVSIIFS